MKKPAKAPKRTRHGPAEYRFKIDAYSPDTMPMARLAEYMMELAVVLGEPASVHFDRLEAGSTLLVHRIDREAIPKVRERAASVERGDAPRDALRSYRRINALLREDNGAGALRDSKRGAPILLFPGRDAAEEAYPTIRQHGSIDGRIMRVGGYEDMVPVLMQAEDQNISGCVADKRLAKRLAERLFEQVRLFGSGRWRRDAEGLWSLVDFKIDSFDVLQEGGLARALGELRLIGAEWDPNAYRKLASERHGPHRRPHGRP